MLVLPTLEQNDCWRRTQPIDQFCEVAIFGHENGANRAGVAENLDVGDAGKPEVTNDFTFMVKGGRDPLRQCRREMVVQPDDHALMTG